MSTLLKLAAAGGALWLLARTANANKCAGRADWEPCGPRSKCLKGKCYEMVRCADDPKCSGTTADPRDPLVDVGTHEDTHSTDDFPPEEGAFLRGIASWTERLVPSSVRNDARVELA